AAAAPITGTSPRSAQLSRPEANAESQGVYPGANRHPPGRPSPDTEAENAPHDWREYLVSKLILLIGAVALTAIAAVTAVASSSTDVKTFNLAVNPKFVKCLAKFPTDPSRPPSATVEVRKGDLNDHLALHLRNVKPGLGFDLFTLQR